MKFEKGKKVKVVGNTTSHGYEIGSNVVMSVLLNKADYPNRDFQAEEVRNQGIWLMSFADCEEIEEDTVKPTHYKTSEVNGMDVIDLVKHWQLNFNEGNVLKYLLRDKGQDESDFVKIIDYAQRELKHLRNL